MFSKWRTKSAKRPDIPLFMPCQLVSTLLSVNLIPFLCVLLNIWIWFSLISFVISIKKWWHFRHAEIFCRILCMYDLFILIRVWYVMLCLSITIWCGRIDVWSINNTWSKLVLHKWDLKVTKIWTVWCNSWLVLRIKKFYIFCNTL